MAKRSERQEVDDELGRAISRLVAQPLRVKTLPNGDTVLVPVKPVIGALDLASK